jgi:1-acyl-sn-glycerol-3-phosphate acyltransferase
MKAPAAAALVRILTGASVRWVNCRPDANQRVYFANHTSHLDALVLWAALPKEIRALARPVAARDYWEVGRVRRHLAENTFRAILIPRNHVTKASNPLESILCAMGDRYSIILFPEGGRNPGPEVGEFKCGLYHLGRARPDLELVPVFMENLNRILPKGECLPVPLLSSVTFGPPIRLMENEPKALFLQRARESVCSLKRGAP